MFDLEPAIAEWRRQMLAAGIKSPGTLEELEGHLREEVQRQMLSGLSAQTAFERAVQQFGPADSLKAEFAKCEAKDFALWGLLGLGALAVTAFVVGANYFPPEAIRDICLMEALLLSFAIPIAASSRASVDASRRRRIAWTGQILMGLCGLPIIFSPYPVLALIAIVVNCTVFAIALRRQNRVVTSS